jgi:DivIVA domain-containing protein
MVEMDPLELREVSLRRSLRGYDTKAVDRLLETLEDSYTFVWRKCMDLEAQIDVYEKREALVGEALISAQCAANEITEQARRSSDLLLHEARQESERVRAEILHLEGEFKTRCRALLGAARELVDRGLGVPVEDEAPEEDSLHLHEPAAAENGNEPAGGATWPPVVSHPLFRSA